jgi:hypothetical protein
MQTPNITKKMGTGVDSLVILNIVSVVFAQPRQHPNLLLIDRQWEFRRM